MTVTVTMTMKKKKTETETGTEKKSARVGGEPQGRKPTSPGWAADPASGFAFGYAVTSQHQASVRAGKSAQDTDSGGLNSIRSIWSSM
jgi:hypothetical protein